MANLQTAIQEARAYYQNPPNNEANTLHRVILPLLRASGYVEQEISLEQPDAAGQKPDITVLEHTARKWFLEAKAWGVALQPQHAAQAVGYANAQDAWLVVLTNGQTWRMYDSKMNGLPQERLVTEVSLDSPEFASFLEAIGRESVLSGEVKSYARRQRVRQILLAQLTDPQSKMIQVLRSRLKSDFDLPDVTVSEVADVLRSLLQPGAPPPSLPVAKSPASPPSAADEVFSLDVMARRDPDPTGRKPQAVLLPDGTRRDVKAWADVLVQVCQWLLENGKDFPVPFRATDRGRDYFVNTTETHSDARAMRLPKRVTGGGREVYVEAGVSAADAVGYLSKLCEAAGVAPSSVRVLLQNEKDRAGGARRLNAGSAVGVFAGR
ncbi:MAG: type I restriction enzyme HsdR N-terminal domain-containing protein [Armatimonadota bacterium]|nr:type I restriction enzyme HsdR N-terminal domain-containing protein [Armatimonadota bacterium]